MTSFNYSSTPFLGSDMIHEIYSQPVEENVVDVEAILPATVMMKRLNCLILNLDPCKLKSENFMTIIEDVLGKKNTKFHREAI